MGEEALSVEHLLVRAAWHTTHFANHSVLQHMAAFSPLDPVRNARHLPYPIKHPCGSCVVSVGTRSSASMIALLPANTDFTSRSRPAVLVAESTHHGLVPLSA